MQTAVSIHPHNKINHINAATQALNYNHCQLKVYLHIKYMNHCIGLQKVAFILMVQIVLLRNCVMFADQEHICYLCSNEKSNGKVIGPKENLVLKK